MSVSGDFSVPNLSISDGTLNDSGTVTVPAGGSLSIGGAAILAGGVRLVNDGSATVTPSAINECDSDQPFSFSLCLSGGSVLENAGTLAVDDNSDVFEIDGSDMGLITKDSRWPLSPTHRFQIREGCYGDPPRR